MRTEIFQLVSLSEFNLSKFVTPQFSTIYHILTLNISKITTGSKQRLWWDFKASKSSRFFVRKLDFMVYESFYNKFNRKCLLG